MVLKKSNCKMNTGATLRGATHAGLYQIEQLPSLTGINVENMLQLTSTISKFKPHEVSCMRECLQEICWYLDLDVPSLKHMTGNRQTSSITESLHIETYSLSKNKMWLLPERIKHMKTDVKFLQSLNKNMDVRFVDLWYTTIATNDDKVLMSKTISALEIIAKSSHSRGQQPNSPSRVRQTLHGRGLQRPHLLNKKIKIPNTYPDRQALQEKETEDKLGYLDINLYGPYRVDARGTYCKHSFTMYAHKSSLKSSRKVKGRQKGKQKCRNYYSNLDVYIQKMDGIRDVYESDMNFTFFDDAEELYTNNESELPGLNYQITDFISINKRLIKKVKKPKFRNTTTDKEFIDTCDTSINRIRHQKGSFIYISKEYQKEHGIENLEVSTLNLDQNIPYLAYSFEDEALLETSKSAMPKLRDKYIQQEANNSTNEFVIVRLVFSEDQTNWFSSPEEHRDAEVLIDNKYVLKLGASFPECFLVDCNANQMQTSGQNWRVLIGRKIQSDSNLWQVSFQCQWQILEDTKKHLQKLIAESNKASFTLSELVDIATARDSGEVRTDTNRISQQCSRGWLSSNNTWRRMALNMFKKVDICTVEEAVSKLKQQLSVESCKNVFNKTTRNAESHDVCQMNECSVCLMDYDCLLLSTPYTALLSCSHTFCISCWRAHLQSCIRNGRNRITCMSTDCSTDMDIATMSTMLPYTLVKIWHDQVWNRRIDSSPFCCWCPNVMCDKVAVSRHETMKGQFGQVVACDCQQCWCSGCLGDPHWPASCDQAAAYRKLLNHESKFTMTVLKDDLVYPVEAKQCPECNYPIEKEEGCPIIRCILCEHLFCFRCLKDSHTNGICKNGDDKTTTYWLKNKIEICGALKWYPKCVTIKQKIDNMQKITTWCQHIHKLTTSPSLPSACVSATREATKTAAVRAQECLLFLRQAYTLQETIHVLVGFAELNKCCESKFYARYANSNMLRLDFITGRLEEAIEKKSLRHIIKLEKTVTQLLQTGRCVMKELSMLVSALQNLSKDIDTHSIEQLNPAQLVRYK